MKRALLAVAVVAMLAIAPTASANTTSCNGTFTGETFDNVTVYCGTYGMHARSSGCVKFLNSALYGSVPPWHVHCGQSQPSRGMGHPAEEPSTSISIGRSAARGHGSAESSRWRGSANTRRTIGSKNSTGSDS